MVFTPVRIRYLLEQARIGREERGGRDYQTLGTLKALAEMRGVAHRHATNPQPAPFHLKKKA